MTNDNSIISRSSGQRAAITDMVFDVTNHSPFGNRPERQDISDHQVGLFAAKDELAGVHALGGDEEFLLVLVAEGVAEGDSGERRAAARVVDDVGDDAFEVAVALAEVEAAEAGGALAVVGVGLEDAAGSFTLCADDPTHFSAARWI